jgi:RhtB (resistance to homoserine/threonine) family protein
MNVTFITVALVGLLAVISPGPDFIIVTRNSLLYSKRVGLATALGIALGNVWWISTSILGISILISKIVWLFTIIKFTGAFYLMYLGFRALFAKKKDIQQGQKEEKKNPTAVSAFRMGLLTNIFNPKCALFFVSFFSIVITPSTSLMIKSLYGLEIITIAVCWFSLLATVLSVDQVKKRFERIAFYFDKATGVLLIALGAKVALYQQK